MCSRHRIHTDEEGKEGEVISISCAEKQFSLSSICRCCFPLGFYRFLNDVILNTAGEHTNTRTGWLQERFSCRKKRKEKLSCSLTRITRVHTCNSIRAAKLPSFTSFYYVINSVFSFRLSICGAQTSWAQLEFVLGNFSFLCFGFCCTAMLRASVLFAVVVCFWMSQSLVIFCKDPSRFAEHTETLIFPSNIYTAARTQFRGYSEYEIIIRFRFFLHFAFFHTQADE